jgi:phospholipid/cholesterol/gamma-HCH transport system permease protein
MTPTRTPSADQTEPGALVSSAGAVGGAFFDIAQTLGGMAVLLARVVVRVLSLPPRLDGPELKRNLYLMAVRSLPIVAVTALFTGAITVIQAAPLVKQYGAEGLLGWGAGFATVRELSPLLTALIISGRVGANNTARLGTMVVTEQVVALRTLAIDPIAFLIVPRFVAIVVTLAVMTLYANALALISAAYAGLALLQVEPVSFYNGFTGGLIHFGDVAHGLIKSVAFGLIIALSSCYFGLETTGGAPGVGRSVNGSVVASAAGVFFFDYVFGFLLG